MPHEQVHRPCTASAMMRPHSALMLDLQISAPPFPGAVVVAARRPLSVPYRLASSSPIRGESSICTAMPGNWLRIAGRQTARTSLSTDPHSLALGVVRRVSIEAAVGRLTTHG